MKTKKALAVLLAVVMLVMPLAVSSFAAGSVVSNPIKTVYNDSEYFNPQGLVVNDGTEKITYTPTDSNFRFEPALNELLTVEITEVSVYYKNELVGTVAVSVEHILGERVTINNGHGNYCLGCGQLHNFEKHIVDEWIPNDDGGIFTLQTQTGSCTVCAAKVTETIPGTEGFVGIFTGETMTELEGTIINYIYLIIGSLIQMLVGIS